MTTWTYHPCPKCGTTARVCEVDGGCRPEDIRAKDARMARETATDYGCKGDRCSIESWQAFWLAMADKIERTG